MDLISCIDDFLIFRVDLISRMTEFDIWRMMKILIFRMDLISRMTKFDISRFGLYAGAGIAFCYFAILLISRKKENSNFSRGFNFAHRLFSNFSHGFNFAQISHARN